ncbi:MAG: hypothetical protein IJS39_13640 [Synergistaceae bacterium]|nr:hypothetical protein [Synergistaceae bacterium]
MKRAVIALIVSVTIFAGRAGYCDDKLNIAVSHPWLALLVSFIGGPEVSVTPLRIWNDKGDLVMAERGKVLRELPEGTRIIALDDKDAKASGLDGRRKFAVKCLYSPFPAKVNALADPSVIPFVAQRVLAALSEWDAQNYPYYQRRLAEFQARMSSSILVGQVLKDVTVCDMSGSAGILLQAAGCRVVRPEGLENWEKGNFSGLREYLDENKAKNITTLMDDDTPPALKKFLAGRSDVFHWERPSLESDYPSFLHEQYISLWQKIITKPLPGRAANGR